MPGKKLEIAREWGLPCAHSPEIGKAQSYLLSGFISEISELKKNLTEGHIYGSGFDYRFRISPETISVELDENGGSFTPKTLHKNGRLVYTKFDKLNDSEFGIPEAYSIVVSDSRGKSYTVLPMRTQSEHDLFRQVKSNSAYKKLK